MSTPAHGDGPEDATITVDGLRFRDLDHDGVLAPYEDHRLPDAVRADDLLGRMTADEKVGLLLHGTATAVGGPLAAIGRGDAYDLDAIAALVHERGVSSMISRLGLPPAELAAQSNAVQRVAAQGRLGIPVTFSTDPRSHLGAVFGAGVDVSGFSLWPGPLGLGATGDPGVVRAFGETLRREYRAVGFHMALSPQADLVTSPRWPRADGCFGEDPARVRACVGAYVEGIQGGRAGVTRQGVAAVVKHWVGYGASEDGFDGHNHYGRFSAFPGGALDAHVEAFLDAFAVGVAGVMPTYNILRGVTIDGEPLEEVGAGFSRQLVAGLLRGTHGYDGLVLSDWGITRDLNPSARTGEPPQGPAEIAMPWGVDGLSRVERVVKGIAAGIDQFGGEDDPTALRQAVAAGLIPIGAVDAAARRVLLLKFRLGLFDDPFVDVAEAARIVGAASARDAGRDAQRRSLVLLEGSRTVPALAPGSAVYLHGFEAPAFEAAGLRVVADPAAADAAVVRLAAPFETLHPGFFFGRMQHEGDLSFHEGDEAFDALRSLHGRVPRTIAVVYLDRPAILTPLRDVATTLVADFGAEPSVIAAALVGEPPTGRLPFQLSRSMDAVLARRCDVPDDDPDPLYPLGWPGA